MKNLTNVAIILFAGLFFMSSSIIAGEHPKSEHPKAKKVEHPKVEKSEHPKAEAEKCQTPGCVDGSCDVCQAKKAAADVKAAAVKVAVDGKVAACEVSKTKKTEHPK